MEQNLSTKQKRELQAGKGAINTCVGFIGIIGQMQILREVFNDPYDSDLIILGAGVISLAGIVYTSVESLSSRLQSNVGD